MSETSESAAPDEWVPVVFAADCDDDWICPQCGSTYADCPCPGPTMDGWEYREREGVLEARPLECVP